MDKLKILIAEDSNLIRTLIELQIKKLGYDYQFVTNGKEAISALAETDFCLVLMDIEMPEMNGIEALEIIRKKYSKPILPFPIVAMTGHDNEEYIQYLNKIGFDAYLSKPFSNIELKNIIEGSLALFQFSNNLPTEKITYDISKLVLLSKGDTEFVSKMLLFIILEITKSIGLLNNEYLANDWESMQRTAHKLSSNLSYFEIAAISQIADQIEEASKKQINIDKIAKYIDLIEKRCNTIFDQIRSDYKLKTN